MNTANDGGPAFPVTPTDRSGQIAPTEFGMSLRDYFAAKAMQTLLGSEYTSEHGLHEGWQRAMSYEAYQVADAMLAAREVKS
jgi:hypothetical protein